jgi:DNA repair protein RadC
MKTKNIINDIKNVSEVHLTYKTKVNPKDRTRVTSSKDAYKLLFDSWNKNMIEHVEEFKLLLLNQSNAVLGILSVSKGGISGTVTDVRLIFQGALKTNASGIIVCHNHPSGNLNPSESDTKITQKIKEAGNIMDIQLLDHLIITAEDWLWISGKTFQVKDTLKELGFRYSPNKRCFYYRQSNHRSGNQEPLAFETIRELYGSSIVSM